MGVIGSALISFFGITLLFTHIGKHWFRRMLGYKGIVDVLLHGTILWMFLGHSTEGLIQAELCAILFSLFLRAASVSIGYEKLTRRGWVRYKGYFERKFL